MIENRKNKYGAIYFLKILELMLIINQIKIGSFSCDLIQNPRNIQYQKKRED